MSRADILPIGEQLEAQVAAASKQHPGLTVRLLDLYRTPGGGINFAPETEVDIALDRLGARMWQCAGAELEPPDDDLDKVYCEQVGRNTFYFARSLASLALEAPVSLDTGTYYELTDNRDEVDVCHDMVADAKRFWSEHPVTQRCVEFCMEYIDSLGLYTPGVRVMAGMTFKHIEDKNIEYAIDAECADFAAGLDSL